MKLQGGADMERRGGEEKKTQSVSREMGPWCTCPPPIPFFFQGHSGIRVQGESHPVLTTLHRVPQSNFPALGQQMEISRQDLGRCARVS